MSEHPVLSAQPTDDEPQTRAKLRGRLGTLGLVFTVVAYNGPLVATAGFIPLVVGYGNGRGAPASFAVIAVLLLVFAVGLSAMSRFMKSPGAFYSYIAAGLGRVLGLGGAFVALLAYYAITAGSTIFSGILIGNLVTGLLNGPSAPWWVWCIPFWLITSTLSTRNVDVSAKVLMTALSVEVALVLAWDLAVGFDGGPSGIEWSAYTPSAFNEGSVTFGLVFAALCFTGFEAVAVFREETKDPVKTVPRATYVTILFLGTIYSLSALTFITAFGPADAVTKGATDPAGSFIESVNTYMGGFATDLITILLVTSAFAAVLACQNITSRYIYALGSDGVISPKLGQVSEKHGSPRNAALLVAGVIAVAVVITALLGANEVQAYATMTGVGGVCLLVLMTLTSLAVVAFFRRANHPANVFQALVAPVLAFIGLGYVLYRALTNMPAVTGLGSAQSNLAIAFIAVVAAAGIGIALVERKRRPDVYARIGRQDI